MTIARCPYCGEDRLIELIGRIWFCSVCGREFKPPTPKTD